MKKKKKSNIEVSISLPKEILKVVIYLLKYLKKILSKIFKLINKRRRKVRARDRYLLMKSFLISFFFIVIICFTLFNKSLVVTSIKEKTLDINSLNTSYLIFTLVFSILVYIILLIIYLKFNKYHLKKLKDIQKLSRMILENNWYEKENRNGREKIKYFPKMLYSLNNGIIEIEVKISLGRYQDHLLSLEKKLESGLYCELIEKELLIDYVKYTLMYDNITSRISINDIEIKKGAIKLMKNLWWEYDELPHMLISGGTGGGKTYFILSLILGLIRGNTELFILDPKNADLADLAHIIPNVYSKEEEMIECLNNFHQRMMERNETMKTMEKYKIGYNYSALGLPAEFLIFDEYVAFMDSLDRDNKRIVEKKMTQIAMLGRQSGFFLLLGCQRPDAKYFADGVRDQFNFRVALGRNSELGYKMMFGDTDKRFFSKRIKGRGYVDTSTNVISEFYTPLVPKKFNFLDEIESAYKDKKHL